MLKSKLSVIRPLWLVHELFRLYFRKVRSFSLCSQMLQILWKSVVERTFYNETLKRLQSGNYCSTWISLQESIKCLLLISVAKVSKLCLILPSNLLPAKLFFNLSEPSGLICGMQLFALSNVKHSLILIVNRNFLLFILFYIFTFINQYVLV